MLDVQRLLFSNFNNAKKDLSNGSLGCSERTDGLPLSCSPSISKEIGKRERVHVEKKQISLAAAPRSSRQKKSTAAAAANKDDRQLKDSKTSRLPPSAKSAWSTHGISIKFSVSQSTTRTKNHGKLKINSCHHHIIKKKQQDSFQNAKSIRHTKSKILLTAN